MWWARVVRVACVVLFIANALRCEQSEMAKPTQTPFATFIAAHLNAAKALFVKIFPIGQLSKCGQVAVARVKKESDKVTNLVTDKGGKNATSWITALLIGDSKGTSNRPSR